MWKKNYLNPLEIRILGYIYFNSPIIDNYENIGRKGNLTTYLVKSEVAKLCEKNWISKKRIVKKLIIKMCKKQIPHYISQAFEEYIKAEDPLLA